MRYFLKDIFWDISYRFSMAMYKLAVFTRGQEQVDTYFDLMEYRLDACMGCNRTVCFYKEQRSVCEICYRKICMTSCMDCGRKIFTQINSKPLHLNMDYCNLCVENLTDEYRETLEHERICIFDPKENNFTLSCKNNSQIH